MSRKTIKDPVYRCPYCGDQGVRVYDSRHLKSPREPVMRRRRRCVECGERWTTYEITDAAYAAICASAKLLGELFPYMHRKSADQIDEANSLTSAEETKP